MFENAKVWEEVFDFVDGWGKIIEIEKLNEYPLKVEFLNGRCRTYNFHGKAFIDERQRLFWDEVEFVVPEKPFKLVNLLNDYIQDGCLIPKDFSKYEDNAYFYYDCDNKKICWDTHCSHYFPGMQRFELNENLLDEIINEANNHNVSLEEFQTAFKELGWL